MPDSAERINRNIVECKNLIFCLIGFINDGINRTIVECKDVMQNYSCKQKIRINRNIVECKADSKT